MNADTQVLIYNLLKDLVILVISVLAGYVIKYVNSHFKATQVETAKSVASMAVTYSEQVSGLLGLKSRDKFNAALEKAKLFAKSHGLNLTDAQWEGLIEEALFDLSAIWNHGNVLKDIAPGMTVNVNGIEPS